MNHTRTLQTPWGNYALYASSALLALCLVAYVMLVFKTVSYTANKQHAHTSMSEVTARVSDLETKYITLKNAINSDTEVARGFKEVSVKNFISRPALGISPRLIQ